MKIEVDEIMTDLPQTPREALALAMIAARERRVTETHNDVLPIYLCGFDDATEAALEAIAALPRCSDGPQTVKVPDGMKLVYVKRWRTIVPLPIAYADEIVEALRPHSSDETAHNVRDATIKEIARYLDEEGHGIPAEKVRFMGPAVTRPHQPGEA